MQAMIDNLINGNCRDARRQAKRKSQNDIVNFLCMELGWSHNRSLLAALYLKTGEGFQAYCDADQPEK